MMFVIQVFANRSSLVMLETCYQKGRPTVWGMLLGAFLTIYESSSPTESEYMEKLHQFLVRKANEDCSFGRSDSMERAQLQESL